MKQPRRGQAANGRVEFTTFANHPIGKKLRSSRLPSARSETLFPTLNRQPLVTKRGKRTDPSAYIPHPRPSARTHGQLLFRGPGSNNDTQTQGCGYGLRRKTQQGAERPAIPATRAAAAEYRDCSCSSASRDAESHVCKYKLGHG
jgi:hypothetical protein